MRLVCRKFNGAGLAAPQIGVAKRVIYLAADKSGPELFLINPEFRSTGGGLVKGDEGCLSYPGVVAIVERFQFHPSQI